MQASNNSLQRTTPAPLSGIAACNRPNGLVQVNAKSVIMLLCRAAGASGKPSLGLVLPLSSGVRARSPSKKEPDTRTNLGLNPQPSAK